MQIDGKIHDHKERCFGAGICFDRKDRGICHSFRVNIQHVCFFLFLLNLFIYFIKAHTRTYIYKWDPGLVQTISTPL